VIYLEIPEEKGWSQGCRLRRRGVLGGGRAKRIVCDSSEEEEWDW